MKFRFNITLTEQDYCEFNNFIATKSYYGKKSLLGLRIFCTVIFLGIAAVYLIGGHFTVDAVINSIPSLLILLLFQLGIRPVMRLTVRWHIKIMKNQGKMPYSAEAVMEFYDDHFSEETAENKTERPYSAIERISVVKDKVIYLHINNLLAHLIPVSAAGSEEQYREFISFMQTKCETVDNY